MTVSKSNVKTNISGQRDKFENWSMQMESFFGFQNHIRNDLYTRQIFEMG